ncbi:hypothetical protein JCM3774_001259 [Rhodotorula dairenensis]
MAPPKSAVAQKLRDDDPSLLPSDDDDSDFHLSGPEHADGGSASDSDSSDSDSGKRKRKRTHAHSDAEPAPAKPALDQAQVEDLWAQFNNPLDDPYANPTAAAAASPAPGNGAADSRRGDDEFVTIEVEYEFAGEKVKQQKRVKRTSVEAQAYFATAAPARSKKPRLASPPAAASSSSSTAPPPPPLPTVDPLDALFGPDTTSAATASTCSATSQAEPPAHPPAAATTSSEPGGSLPPAAKRLKTGGAGRGGKRGGGGGLAGMAAALGVAGAKPAKLNTLEKSKLDWSSYVSSETGLEDSLAHARKDGYLDRRDFLDRVESSKEEQWDHARQAAARRKR